VPTWLGTSPVGVGPGQGIVGIDAVASPVAPAGPSADAPVTNSDVVPIIATAIATDHPPRLRHTMGSWHTRVGVAQSVATSGDGVSWSGRVTAPALVARRRASFGRSAETVNVGCWGVRGGRMDS
jgi:hypothetical protein